MLPEATDRAGAISHSQGRFAAYAPALAALLVGLALLATAFWPECKAAFAVWNSSTAYGHCYLVLPMAVYLAWDRRQALVGLAAQPMPALTILALPVAVGWLIAERLGIMEGRQLLALAAVELLFLVVLGWSLFRALLGPLLYLVFLVPFGAFLTPGLQQFTAAFTVAGLNLVGIPNYADQLTIEIPAGVFYVAEACAGLRFLIAAVAFGVFYALLNYRRPGRRIAFIAASVVVPIVANGVRAFGIVALGHLIGSAEAAAADHVIYGWVFFSVVMLLLVAAGLPLREPPAGPSTAKREPSAGSDGAPIWAALATCVMAASGPAAAHLLDLRVTAAALTALPGFTLPDGCSSRSPWTPVPASHAVLALDCGGQEWRVTVDAFPARSTAAALLGGRRRVTGEMEAEDADVAPLHTGKDGTGSWTLIQTSRPYLTAAVAAWADGRPAPGGWTGRLQQARDSVLGSDHVVVLMVIRASMDSRPTPDYRRALVEQIRRLVDAQSGLNQKIEALSRTGG